MTHEALVEGMVPIARRLIGAVQKVRTREAVARVLATVPDESAKDALLVVLAAMVEPDVNPEDLLAWTDALTDRDSPQAREQRRLESLNVPSSTAQLLAARAAEQDPQLTGHSPPVRAEKAAIRDERRARDRDRKQAQRDTIRERMLQVTHNGKATA